MLSTGPVSLPSSVAHQSAFVETHKLSTGVEEDSSSLRAQSSSKATIDSYQKWADEVDDQSYKFDNLLPYFQKLFNTPPQTKPCT
jgi:hypothetical protein